ncbi:DUF3027 domain-containing protein [Streptomyces zingiberis]|uniref:DUF3027 domain-containing protein n=1 Tax=Streptomyces zingiberis TaxID=2053010 RepID=A0ABX1BXC7_9ACTN|nr:DUF3027 domain-containing protein [Streptomyces zingiberis]NJP99963.1 DUF3027 domain-containing protein [Streptomyces zingiberis]
MRSRTPDRLCAEAVDMARGEAVAAAGEVAVGEHLGVVADADRVVTHYFACREPAYRGWRWSVTVARASRARNVTLDETVLVPGDDAILAPEWVPWSERLRPGDLGPGDLLPTEDDDPRLEPGWTGADGPPPDSPFSEEAEERAAAEREAAASAGPPLFPAPERAAGSLAAVGHELGLMGRARVLSRYGLSIAADRWEEAHGARTAMAQAAPADCGSCGFLMPLTGSLRQAFGVCANEFSPADGRMVSLAYGCGGHSEAAVVPKAPPAPQPVIDETRVDHLSLRPARDETAEPGADGPDGEPDGDSAGER